MTGSRRLWWAGLAAVVLLAGAGVGVARLASTTPAPPAADTAGTSVAGELSAAAQRELAANPAVDAGSRMDGRPAPGFTLTDQSGHPVSLAQFRGRPVLLAFVDSQCTTVCPLTTASMVQARALLGPAGSQLALVGIDANPIATSVADVRAYSAAHGLLDSWHFLTGSPSQLAAVWRAYGVYVAASQGNIDHEPAIFLIDQHGRERSVFITQMAQTAVAQQAEVLARAAAALLPGDPRLTATTSLAYVPGIGPGQRAVLPNALGGTPVVLGPGHAHLVVFFASWLSETTDLAARLRQLDAYAASARAHGWPSLVLVDEATSEPTPGALRAFLASLPAPLPFPVAVDSTGAVADGYGMQDEPWFSLTSASGQILLSNDGWFPIPALQAAVSQRERGS